MSNKQITVAFNGNEQTIFAKIKKKLPFKYQQKTGFAKFVHDAFDNAVGGYNKQ